MADAVEAVQLGSGAPVESVEQEQPSQAPAPVEGAPAEPATAPKAPEDQPGEMKLEDLPESWQKEIRDLRREAAAKRAAARDEGDDRDSQLERIAALEARLEQAEADKAEAAASAQKTQILAERGLPTKFLPMLAGADAEAWEQSADSLVELRGARGAAPDPVQAAVSSQSDTNSARDRLADEFFAGLN